MANRTWKLLKSNPFFYKLCRNISSFKCLNLIQTHIVCITTTKIEIIRHNQSDKFKLSLILTRFCSCHWSLKHKLSFHDQTLLSFVSPQATHSLKPEIWNSRLPESAETFDVSPYISERTSSRYWRTREDLLCPPLCKQDSIVTLIPQNTQHCIGHFGKLHIRIKDLDCL